MAPVVERTFDVRVLVESMTVWMLTHHASPPEDPADLFHSKFATDSPPHPLAREATVIYMALSMWEDIGIPTLKGLAAANPNNPQFVAKVTLKPKAKSKLTGVCVADTEAPGHWSASATLRTVTYSIYNDGHLVVTYRDAPEEARAALIELATDAPESAQSLTLMAVRDDGHVEGGYSVSSTGAVVDALAHAA